MKFNSKIALVTGGSRGLGRNMALQLARNGADVVITYRTQQAAAESVCSEIQGLGRKAACLPLDTGHIVSFPEFSSRFEVVLQDGWQRADFDFLVNNAGFGVHAPFAQTTTDQFDSLLNVHFKGVFFLTQTLLSKLADGGRIVCISTGLTRFAVPGYAAYASMKGATEVLVKYLAKELGPRHITVNAVAPGAIETDFTRGAFEHDPHLKGVIASGTALGRVGLPDDIGGVVAFLCSEEGRWVNARRIEASGGTLI